MQIQRIRDLEVAGVRRHQTRSKPQRLHGAGFIGDPGRRIERLQQQAMAKHLRRLRLPEPFARNRLQNAAIRAGALQGVGNGHGEQAAGIVLAHLGDQFFDQGYSEAGPCRIVHQHPVVADTSDLCGHGAQAVGNALRAGLAAAAQDTHLGAEREHLFGWPECIVRRQHYENFGNHRRGAQSGQRVPDHGVTGQRQVLLGH